MMATVYAANTPQDKSTQKVTPSQLPIYDEPAIELDYIPEKLTPLRQNISEVRKVVWNFTDKFQTTTDKVKLGYNTAKKYGEDALTYVQGDAGVLQRAGIITLAGFGGVVLGYRGGILRKAALASTGMVTAAAFCYPEQAVDISKRGWEQVQEQAKELWYPAPALKSKPIDVETHKEEKAVLQTPLEKKGNH